MGCLSSARPARSNKPNAESARGEAMAEEAPPPLQRPVYIATALAIFALQVVLFVWGDAEGISPPEAAFICASLGLLAIYGLRVEAPAARITTPQRNGPPSASGINVAERALSMDRPVPLPQESRVPVGQDGLHLRHDRQSDLLR